jgi:hypothetical protein
MPVFELRWSTYDSDERHFFESPLGATHASFRLLCDQLMCEAAGEQVHGPADHWIGYLALADRVAEKLPGYGYRRLEVPAAHYKHHMTITSVSAEDDAEDELLRLFGHELLAQIIEHNARADAQISEKCRNLKSIETD